MLYRCDSNNSGCREGAAPERGEQAEHRQKETLKEGSEWLVQQLLLFCSSSLGWFWLWRIPYCSPPMNLTAALQGLHREACAGTAPSHLGYFHLCPPSLYQKPQPHSRTDTGTDQQCQQQDRHLDHVWAPPTTQGRCRGVLLTRTPSSAQHPRTADFLMPARGLGTGLEDFVSIISPAPAPRGFALWACRASW